MRRTISARPGMKGSEQWEPCVIPDLSVACLFSTLLEPVLAGPAGLLGLALKASPPFIPKPQLSPSLPSPTPSCWGLWVCPRFLDSILWLYSHSFHLLTSYAVFKTWLPASSSVKSSFGIKPNLPALVLESLFNGSSSPQMILEDRKRVIFCVYWVPPYTQ